MCSKPLGYRRMTDREIVGFRDALRFGVGAAAPAVILVSALIIAGFVAAGADVGPGITAAFTAAFVLAIALEMFRRIVLARRSDGLQAIFRGFVWTIVLAALPVTVILGVGVMTQGYGHKSDALGSFMLAFMFACCVCTLPMVRMGYLLLRDAVWLKPRQSWGDRAGPPKPPVIH